MKLADRVEENVSFQFFLQRISECQINLMIAKPTQVDQLQTRLGDWVNNLTNTDSSGVAEVTR